MVHFHLLLLTRWTRHPGRSESPATDPGTVTTSVETVEALERDECWVVHGGIRVWDVPGTLATNGLVSVSRTWGLVGLGRVRSQGDEERPTRLGLRVRVGPSQPPDEETDRVGLPLVGTTWWGRPGPPSPTERVVGGTSGVYGPAPDRPPTVPSRGFDYRGRLPRVRRWEGAFLPSLKSLLTLRCRTTLPGTVRPRSSVPSPSSGTPVPPVVRCGTTILHGIQGSRFSVIPERGPWAGVDGTWARGHASSPSVAIEVTLVGGEGPAESTGAPVQGGSEPRGVVAAGSTKRLRRRPLSTRHRGQTDAHTTYLSRRSGARLYVRLPAPMCLRTFTEKSGRFSTGTPKRGEGTFVSHPDESTRLRAGRSPSRCGPVPGTTGVRSGW